MSEEIKCKHCGGDVNENTGVCVYCHQNNQEALEEEDQYDFHKRFNDNDESLNKRKDDEEQDLMK